MRQLGVLLLVMTWASAETLSELLAEVAHHPSLLAAQAAVEAAEARLEGTFGSVSLGASVGYARLALDEPTLPQASLYQAQIGEGQPPAPQTNVQVSLESQLRPFVFGDVADLARQQEIDLERARLNYLEALTGLEIQAVEAVLGVELASRSLELAAEADAMAREALEATRVRADRGAATATELREAEASLYDAEAQTLNAGAELELARRSLVSLAGREARPEIPAFPPVGGTPLEVRRAQLDLELARVGLGSAERGLYPVAQASYTYNFDDHSSLSLGLESRTLQPSLAYSYQDPGRTFPQNQIRGNFQVGVSINLSPDLFAGLEAAGKQVAASEAALAAAHERAELQALSRANATEGAKRQLELAAFNLENAEVRFAEASRRLELGLIAPLEHRQAVLTRTQAEIAVHTARLELLRRTLDAYLAYGIPLSEVLE
jgi:outer membrane protein